MKPYDAALLCQSIYSPKQGDFDKILKVGVVDSGIKYIDGFTVVVFRGSCDAEDWLQDFRQEPDYDQSLGSIAAGFLDDMREFAKQLANYIKGDLIITGHSLGAARSCILGALVASKQIILFGCPKLGYDQLKELVKSKCPSILSFKNHDDIVTTLPPLCYNHVIEPTQIMSMPTPLTDIQAHEIGRYVEALSH